MEPSPWLWYLREPSFGAQVAELRCTAGSLGLGSKIKYFLWLTSCTSSAVPEFLETKGGTTQRQHDSPRIHWIVSIIFDYRPPYYCGHLMVDTIYTQSPIALVEIFIFNLHYSVVLCILVWCKFIIWSPFSSIFGYMVGGVMTFNNSSLYLSQMHFPDRANTIKILTDWRIFHSFALSTLTVVATLLSY